MQAAGHGRSLTFWEWIAILAIVVATVAGTKLANLSSPRQTAVAYTAITFACISVTLRPAWGRANFWLALAASLVVHTIAVFFAIQEFPASVARDFHSVPMILFGIIEGLLIASFVWRASVQKGSPRSS
jgi:hypothetical protein